VTFHRSIIYLRKHLGVIQQLYIGKYQCRSCGLRFTSKHKQAYTYHLDWHFLENQKASAAAARLQSCRDWYSSLQEWTIYEENLDEQIRHNQLMSKQNRHTKDHEHKSLSSMSSTLSTDMISCPAKSNGDLDDDVRDYCSWQYHSSCSCSFLALLCLS
jgi:hypothetical protein